MKAVGLYHKKYLDIVTVLLLDRADDTHLPELYDVFGREVLSKFLELFAGMTIRIPTREEIETSVRNVSIFLQVYRTAKGSKARVMYDIARHYGMVTDEVRRIYYRMEKRLRGVDLECLLQTRP